MKAQQFQYSPILFCLLLFSSCSTSPKVPSASADQTGLLHAKTTSVEIDYFLGHNQHKFYAEGVGERAEVTTYLERTIVEQARVDQAKYTAFVAKAVDFAEKPKRAPSQEVECRSPFNVKVKIDEKSYTSQGCRSSDNEGSLSRLVRDGEFLLYSKK